MNGNSSRVFDGGRVWQGYGHAGQPHRGKEGQVGDSRDGPPVELIQIGCERDGYPPAPSSWREARSCISGLSGRRACWPDFAYPASGAGQGPIMHSWFLQPH